MCVISSISVSKISRLFGCVMLLLLVACSNEDPAQKGATATLSPAAAITPPHRRIPRFPPPFIAQRTLPFLKNLKAEGNSGFVGLECKEGGKCDPIPGGTASEFLLWQIVTNAAGFRFNEKDQASLDRANGLAQEVKTFPSDEVLFGILPRLIDAYEGTRSEDIKKVVDRAKARLIEVLTKGSLKGDEALKAIPVQQLSPIARSLSYFVAIKQSPDSVIDAQLGRVAAIVTSKVEGVSSANDTEQFENLAWLFSGQAAIASATDDAGAKDNALKTAQKLGVVGRLFGRPGQGEGTPAVEKPASQPLGRGINWKGSFASLLATVDGLSDLVNYGDEPGMGLRRLIMMELTPRWTNPKMNQQFSERFSQQFPKEVTPSAFDRSPGAKDASLCGAPGAFRAGLGVVKEEEFPLTTCTGERYLLSENAWAISTLVKIKPVLMGRPADVGLANSKVNPLPQ